MTQPRKHLKLDASTARDLGDVMRTFSRTKTVQASITKAPTDGTGRFTALVSTFGPPPDSMGDVVQVGAFDDTIRRAYVEHPRALWPVWWSHQYDDPASAIGVITAAAATPKGLVVEGQLNLDSAKAMIVYEGLLSGAIREWSISYGVVEERRDTWEGEPVTVLEKVELLEVSAVWAGANRNTRTLAVKANTTSTAVSTTASNATVTWTGEPQSELDRINAKLDALASRERRRDPAAAKAVDDLILSVREELVQEALDRAEQAAWEKRVNINRVLAPVPVRVDARMRPNR